MLDEQTKKQIDDCRNVLVGKVASPQKQIEQITIALIYKFMDDMDNESVAMGGKKSFFVGDYEKYSWTAIFDSSLAGEKMLRRYRDGLEGMSKNPSLPRLFTDIFERASLPYTDPATLKLFLKHISVFSYSNSEKLGDAFEYLLSSMGSQGDAGQFRTPRNIIDFLVKVIDPKKNETVLEPACGTAGFMISAFKHILSENKNLTPDEKKRLLTNFTGYDIEPEMVRLSLVNLYLHGFSDPKIYEYDTLTSDSRWEDTFDVILANPPFMTPKGGIIPHDKFSISAKKSEVLFVDYIAEHLNPGGRAGIIVPEGIIFTVANAYKNLRKMLVDDYLWAVVSLPAGVFNPYSGVKTSILLLDKTKAKNSDSILFVTVDNDGFDLGAQRRAIDNNDLPEALKILKNGNTDNTEIAHWVEKTKIEESGDWNLSGERYKQILAVSENYEMVELGNVVEILDNLRKPITKSNRISGDIPYYGATGIVDYVNEYIFDERLVLLGEDGAKWSENEKTAFIAEGKYWVNNHAHVLRPKEEKLIDTYLVEVLNIMDLNPYITGITVPKLNQKMMRSIQIPLPPLSVQEEIVAEIDGYQKMVDGARQVVENYKPTIKIDPEWEMVKLGEVCKIKSGGTPSRKVDEYWNGDIPWVGSTVCKDKKVGEAKEYITELGLNKSAAKIFKINTTLIALVGATIGKTGLLSIESTTNQNIAGVNPIDEKRLHPIYLFYATQTLYSEFMRLGSGKFRMANLSFIRQLKIPFPPVSIQEEIVAQIEAEQEMVNANKKLVEIYEQKIKDKIREVWGD